MNFRWSLVLFLALFSILATPLWCLQPAASAQQTQAGLRPLTSPQPVYPPDAIKEGIHGEVWIKVSIAEDGSVESAEIVSGPPMLAAAALEAARQWRFTPFLKDGKPSRIDTKLKFDFQPPVLPPNGPTVLPLNDPRAKRVQLSESASQAMLVFQVPPDYPEKARERGIEGEVKMTAVIGKDGKLADIKVKSGHKLLVPAALDAVRQWRYKPFEVGGKPLEVETEMTVRFYLHP